MPSNYYNGACANQVMRKNGGVDVSGLDAAEECNRLLNRIKELEADYGLFVEIVSSQEEQLAIIEGSEQLATEQALAAEAKVKELEAEVKRLRTANTELNEWNKGIEAQLDKVRNCQTYVVELDDCEQSWFKKTDVLEALEGE